MRPAYQPARAGENGQNRAYWEELAELPRLVVGPAEVSDGGAFFAAMLAITFERGITTVNVAPCPGALSTSTFPPHWSTMFFTMNKPRSAPPVVRLAIMGSGESRSNLLASL